jgi:hypothetical protein
MIGNLINFEHDCGQKKTSLLLKLLPHFDLSQYLLGWAINWNSRPNNCIFLHCSNLKNKTNAYGALVIQYEIVPKTLGNVE